MREERQREMVGRLRILPGAQERLSTLATRGRKLPPLREGERNDENLVAGCVSRVWLVGEAVEGQMHFRADCDSVMVKGLAALLCALVEGLPASEVAALPDVCSVWEELGLDGQISPTRLRGLAAVWRQLRALGRDGVAGHQAQGDK